MIDNIVIAMIDTAERRRARAGRCVAPAVCVILI
jgi:hypothetical protein